MLHFLKKYTRDFLILLLCFLLYSIDDNLDPKIQKIVEQVNHLKANEAYFYLMGIDTAADQDPMVVGKNIFERGKKITDEIDDNFTVNLERFEQFDKKRKKLVLPQLEADILCREENPCFKKILADTEKYKQKIQQHQILVQRYQKFLTFDQYQQPNESNFSLFSPSYRFFTIPNKIIILNAIIQASEKQPQQAINNLLNNIKGLRKKLWQTDDYIGKFILSSLIAQNLDTLSLIAYKNHLQLKEELKPLSKKEKDLEIVFARELAALYNNSKIMKQNASFYDFPWLFKPNMSINKLYLFHNQLLEKNKLAPKDFAKLINQKENKKLTDVIKTAWSYFRNPEGEIFRPSIKSYYFEYIASLFELDAKIILFNQIHYQGITDFNTIKSPYFENEFVFFSKDKRSLCLKPIYLQKQEEDQIQKRTDLCLKLRVN